MGYFLLASLIIGSLVINQAVTFPIVQQEVYATIVSQGHVDVILHFPGHSTSQVAAAYRSRNTLRQRIAHPSALPAILKAQADKAQASIKPLLQSRKSSKGLGFSQLWILNQCVVYGVDRQFLDTLKRRDDIILIEAKVKYQVVAPVTILDTGSNVQSFSTLHGTQCAPALVGAPTLWDMGYTGKGVVVANIDTGVRGSHAALWRNHRSSYGWYDPVNNGSVPYDDHSHGTHTMGSICGANGIGVAPGATWIACKSAASDGGAWNSDLRTCGQWVMCPTDSVTMQEDCSMRPHIISNSWGSTTPDPFYNDIIDAWVAAGIIAIFANGNAGPDCSTTGSPADHPDVISVGATDCSGSVAYYSSRGPTDNGQIKPDVCAPGSSIVSSTNPDDTTLAYKTGTSMAAPTVAGVAALLASANHSLTNEDIKRFIIAGAQPIDSAHQTCGDASDTDRPNNVVGYGLVNAPAAFELVKANAAAI